MQLNDEQYEVNDIFDPNNNSDNTNYHYNTESTNNYYQQNQYQIYFDDEYNALSSANVTNNDNNNIENVENNKIGGSVSTDLTAIQTNQCYCPIAIIL